MMIKWCRERNGNDLYYYYITAEAGVGILGIFLVFSVGIQHEKPNEEVVLQTVERFLNAN